MNNDEDDDDDKPDWLERTLVWLELHHERILIFLIAFAISAIAWNRLIAHERRETAQRRANATAIERHVTWLQGLPESEKRKWRVSTYCHPPAAPRGRCECDGDYGTSEAAWPERLENGDVACHVQK